MSTPENFDPGSKPSKPPSRSGLLRPIIAAQHTRWNDSFRSVQHWKNETTRSILDTSSDYLPLQWRAAVNPYGAVYFYRSHGMRVTTDSPLYIRAISEQILEWASEIEMLADSKGRALKGDVELYLQLDDKDCNYYFADHARRTLLWLEDYEADELGVPNFSATQLIQTLEAQYLAHIEDFPMDSCGLPKESPDESMPTFWPGGAGDLTASTPASPLILGSTTCQKCSDIPGYREKCSDIPPETYREKTIKAGAECSNCGVNIPPETQPSLKALPLQSIRCMMNNVPRARSASPGIRHWISPVRETLVPEPATQMTNGEFCNNISSSEPIGALSITTDNPQDLFSFLSIQPLYGPNYQPHPVTMNSTEIFPGSSPHSTKGPRMITDFGSESPSSILPTLPFGWYSGDNFSSASLSASQTNPTSTESTDKFQRQSNMFSKAHDVSIRETEINSIGGDMTVNHNYFYAEPQTFWDYLPQWPNLSSNVKPHVSRVVETMKGFLPDSFLPSPEIHLEDNIVVEDTYKYPPLCNLNKRTIKKWISMWMPGFTLPKFLLSNRLSFF